jgi:hypothetical protein
VIAAYGQHLETITRQTQGRRAADSRRGAGDNRSSFHA